MSGLPGGITGLSDSLLKGSHLQGAVPHQFQHLPDVSFAISYSFPIENHSEIIYIPNPTKWTKSFSSNESSHN